MYTVCSTGNFLKPELPTDLCPLSHCLKLLLTIGKTNAVIYSEIPLRGPI
jgi:hypothetical protein